MKKIALTVAIFSMFAFYQGPSYLSYGDKITPSNAMSTEALLEMVSDEEKTVKIKGFAEEVCQMKGCWLTLRNEQGKSIRVTFKDYGFFVPKDISGREIILEGVAVLETLDEETAKHYAEDAGKTFDPSMQKQVSVVASGVLVKKS